MFRPGRIFSIIVSILCFQRQFVIAKLCFSADQHSGVEVDKNGNISIKIVAKPAAECNRITGIDEEGIKVRINAPPVEGEANQELIKYMASVLQLRKTDITLAKGAKSKHKTIQILAGIIKYYEVVERIRKELPTGSK